jgi:CheY-like chemotaxis protein
MVSQPPGRAAIRNGHCDFAPLSRWSQENWRIVVGNGAAVVCIMNEKTRILILEDDAADAVLINKALRDGGLDFSSKRVDTEAEFMHEIEAQMPDVILSDHGLPAFDGFAALSVAREHCPDVPFIFVTGALGEEVAISSFESGATDYVLKNRLSHLTPVVQRALREAGDRRSRKWLEVEREQLIKELKDALTQIKSLSGLLPICTLCKSVRDHLHGWQPLEAYLQKHSDATLTQELCPDCVEKIYPAAFGGRQPGAGLAAEI